MDNLIKNALTGIVKTQNLSRVKRNSQRYGNWLEGAMRINDLLTAMVSSAAEDNDDVDFLYSLRIDTNEPKPEKSATVSATAEA